MSGNRLHYYPDTGKFYLKKYSKEYEQARKSERKIQQLLENMPECPRRTALEQERREVVARKKEGIYLVEVRREDYSADAKIVQLYKPPEQTGGGIKRALDG